MKPTAPWSVKGVDDDARESAKNAAQAAGLTLGAWIDRAIKKSTGLVPDSPNPGISTTTSTTLSEASPEDRVESSDVAWSATSEPQTRSVDAGDAAAAANHAGPDDPAPEHASTSHDLQVDPEDRLGAMVEPVVTPQPRRWPSLSVLPGAGRPRIGVAAAAVVVGAGVLVYWVALAGPDDRDLGASTTDRAVARAAAPPAPPTPDRARRDDTPPPPEPGVIEMLTAAAEQGDAVAEHDLAVRYLDGKTVARDLAAAVKWLERAATQGMASAQHRLAVMYDDGTSVRADPNRAAMWHTRAASQGHPGSQHALALAYDAGRGVKQSEASAVEWLRRAARAGNIASQFLLAERYENGSGVARSSAKAAEWYARAAANGHAGAAARAKKLAAATETKPVARTSTIPPAGAARPADAPLDKAGIAEVQRLLAGLAFKPGPADGVLGQRTVREIKLYQSFGGLPNDGKATYGLLQELREMMRGMSAETNPPRR